MFIKTLWAPPIPPPHQAPPHPVEQARRHAATWGGWWSHGGNVQGRPDVIKEFSSDEPVAANENDKRKGAVAKLPPAAHDPSCATSVCQNGAILAAVWKFVSRHWAVFLLYLYVIFGYCWGWGGIFQW